MREDRLQSSLGRVFPGSASHATPPGGHPSADVSLWLRGHGAEAAPRLDPLTGLDTALVGSDL